MQPLDLRDHLADLLVLAADVLTNTDGALDPPDRQYVAHGRVAWDCEQLTVHVVNLIAEPQDDRGANCNIVHRATIATTLVRCAPTPDDRGNPPSSADLDAFGLQMAADGGALWKGMTRATADGQWPVGLPCRRVRWVNLQPLAPSGGFAGWQVNVELRP